MKSHHLLFSSLFATLLALTYSQCFAQALWNRSNPFESSNNRSILVTNELSVTPDNLGDEHNHCGPPYSLDCAQTLELIAQLRNSIYSLEHAQRGLDAINDAPVHEGGDRDARIVTGTRLDRLQSLLSSGISLVAIHCTGDLQQAKDLLARCVY